MQLATIGKASIHRDVFCVNNNKLRSGFPKLTQSTSVYFEKINQIVLNNFSRLCKWLKGQVSFGKIWVNWSPQLLRGWVSFMKMRDLLGQICWSRQCCGLGLISDKSGLSEFWQIHSSIYQILLWHFCCNRCDAMIYICMAFQHDHSQIHQRCDLALSSSSSRRACVV